LYPVTCETVIHRAI